MSIYAFSVITLEFLFPITLEIVDRVIAYTIGYMDMFTPSTIPINSIQDFEDALNEVIPKALKLWKDSKFYVNIDRQLDGKAVIAVLDTKENKLYYADLGKVWRSADSPDYKVVLNLLDDGFYSFGIVATPDVYKQIKALDKLDKGKALNFIESLMKAYKLSFPKDVGDIGSRQISIIGDYTVNEFISCFGTYTDYIQTAIDRRKYENS